MKTLNHHQRYLVEEFAADYLARSLSRRDLLRRSLLATGTAVSVRHNHPHFHS